MNGVIVFESTHGEGSFFYINIPILDKTSVHKKTENECSIKRSDINEDRNKKKVLYIEDIPANVELVRQILNYRPGIELISSPDALDGIQKANENLPDLILMDIHLPEMDGLTAFKKLKSIDRTENIPVIALTADAMSIDVQRAIDLGFHSYITKPIDVRKFIETIDSVIPETDPS